MAALRRSLPVPPSISRIAFSPASGAEVRQMDPIRSLARKAEFRTIAEKRRSLPNCRQLTGDSHPLAVPSNHGQEPVETDSNRGGDHGSRCRTGDCRSTDVRWWPEFTQHGIGAFGTGTQFGLRQERRLPQDGPGSLQASGDKRKGLLSLDRSSLRRRCGQDRSNLGSPEVRFTGVGGKGAGHLPQVNPRCRFHRGSRATGNDGVRHGKRCARIRCGLAGGIECGAVSGRRRHCGVLELIGVVRIRRLQVDHPRPGEDPRRCRRSAELPVPLKFRLLD